LTSHDYWIKQAHPKSPFILFAIYNLKKICVSFPVVSNIEIKEKIMLVTQHFWWRQYNSITKLHEKKQSKLGSVENFCNPSYWGGRDLKNWSWRPTNNLGMVVHACDPNYVGSGGKRITVRG
jgi:hypothetical protein